MGRVLTNNQAYAESKAVELSRLKAFMHDSEAWLKQSIVVHVRVDDLTSKPGTLRTGTNQSKTEHDAFSDLTFEMDVDAAKHDSEFGVWVRAMPSLNNRIAAGNTRANTTGLQAYKKLKNRS